MNPGKEDILAIIIILETEDVVSVSFRFWKKCFLKTFNLIAETISP